MAETDPNPTTARRPRPGQAVLGVLALLVAVYVLTDGATWLPDLRWLLAGGAVLGGVLMLGTSLRDNKKSR